MDPNISTALPEAEVCFKCQTKISHVPYKFEGNFFHARCLLCNTCGKRLIGKPFVTAESQIFCNNKCLQLYHSEGPKLQAEVQSNTAVPHHQPNSNGLLNVPNFSLNGLLDKMQYHTYLYHGHNGYNCNGQTGEGRVTDYPVAHPSFNQQSSFQSETDSVSTVSESSFTSDSSFAYDANRKPKKKILKKSTGPRSKHKRRVRWNFDNLESFSDVDSVSLDSSSSLSSCGRPYYCQTQPQDHAFHYLSNGHDLTRNAPKMTEYPLNNKPPTSVTPYSTEVPFPSSKVSHAHGLYRTYSGSICRPRASSSQGHHFTTHHNGSINGQYQKTHSRSMSNQDLHHIVQHSSPILNHPARSHSSTRDSEERRVVNVPILHLEDVPELNESNLEERERRHLFEFPAVSSQNTYKPLPPPAPPSHNSVVLSRSRSSSDVSNPQSLTSNSSSSFSSQSSFSTFQPVILRNYSPVGSPSMVKTNRYQGNHHLKRVPENEDEPDYDHLAESDPVPVGPTAKECLKPRTPDDEWYSNDDIDEALQIIEGSEHEGEDEKGTPLSPSPPPVPVKQRKHKNLPPPVPPKKLTLKTVHPQEVPCDETSQDESVNGLILSPPQGFKSSSCDHQHHSKQGPLHSPSSETLMPIDASQSDSNLTPMETEVHPESKWPFPPNKHSWAPKTMDDRIIEGAEDPRKSPICIPPHPSTSFVPKMNTVFPNHHPISKIEPLTNGMESLSLGDNACHLQRHNSFSPKASKQEVSTGHYQLRRSRTIPKNMALSKEDEAVLQWYRKRPPMKPLIVDTDKEIDEMMAEMEREKNVARRSPRQSTESLNNQVIRNNCFACNKPVEDLASVVNFASRVYHSSCFCCSHCRCLLKGTQIFTLQGVLMCASDYNRIMSKQQKEQLSRMHTVHHSKLKSKHRSQSASSLLSSTKSREDIVISPPIQSLEHTFNKSTTMV